jgi:Uma2 family endonuclease
MVHDTGSVAIIRRRLTADEYQKMGEVGILRADERVELIEGELVAMSPIGSRHIGCVVILTKWFGDRVGDRAYVSVQNSLRLSEDSEPEPDIVLLRPRADRYRDSLPRPEDVLLIVEVADSSLAYDRDTKMRLYARAGIPEAWLMDVDGERIVVCRGPTPDGYAEVTEHRQGARLRPLAFPDLELTWEDVFA